MYSLLRIGSVACVAAMVALAPDAAAFESFAWSLAFAHYLLGLVYSQGPLRALAGDASRWPAAAGLGVATLAVWIARFPLPYYFGVHHVLNEVYMLDRVTRARGDARVRALRHAGLALHTLLYVALLHDSRAFVRLPLSGLLGALALCYAVYGLFWWRARGVLSRGERVDHLAVELAALPFLAAVIGFGWHVSVLEVATYHFVFWVGYPALARRDAGAALPRYLLAMAAATAGFVLLSPLALVTPHFGADTYAELFVVLSYVHITLSFALSDANPGFVRAWFRRRAAAPATA